MKKDITFLVLAGIGLLCSMLDVDMFEIDAAWIAVILCGLPIILEAVIGLVTEFDIKADVLVSLALIASLIIGEYFAAGEIAFIMQIGALLEDITVARARSGIEKLIHLTPRTARRILGESEETIEAEMVRKGDLLRVLPGEMIPADGVIISGETSVDQSVMTGESVPVDKLPGDKVKSGTMNQYGAFEMKASCDGEDSSMQRMVKLVQSTDADKAKIVGIADRWATWIVVIALTAAVLTYLIKGEVIRSVTILVVFCPCALVLATPTAIMAAIGNLTGHGVLVRQGDALERMAQVQKITFDKTGTLTYGKPQVAAVKSFLTEFSDERLFGIMAASESRSEHPLGKAVLSSYQKKYQCMPEDVLYFQMLPGFGVSAVVDGYRVEAGNLRFMKQCGARFEETETGARKDTAGENNPWNGGELTDYLNKGCTIIYIAIDGRPAGFLALSDTLRENASEMVSSIRNQGVVPVLLTGDHREAAGYIGEKVGISEIYADCLPQDKMDIIESYADGKEYVCMVGDGVNDAPALKKAYVGIAMGGIGSDIAIEAADIALVRDDIFAIPHIAALSRKMMKTIKLNMIFAMSVNTIAIVLAMAGMLLPVAGALIHNGGSVLVIINSALLLKWKNE
ncbi:MAG: cation-translocating P-type ATPase [Blautia sp.]|nr:cation-translocating P-type ATPase [Blautia sp.]MDY3998867.1 cation-translocating P-type ATPase [Blautia sp.]